MKLAAASLAILALAAGAAPLSAQSPPAAPAAHVKKVRTLLYLTPEEIDARRLIAPPPQDGSLRASADVAEVQAAIRTASPARAQQAKWDAEHEDPSLFKPTLGEAFDMKALPATADLLAVVQNDSEVAASAAKKMFPRRRPWAVDASIKTCDPGDKPMTSYPSGHATLGYALSMTLAAVVPAQASKLMSRADDYAYSREICGSHFADDTQASQALAAAMMTALLAKPEFQAKIEAARRELAASSLDLR